MLQEKKRIDAAKYRLQAYLFFGGKLPELDDEEEREGIPGVDYPDDSGASF